MRKKSPFVSLYYQSGSTLTRYIQIHCLWPSLITSFILFLSFNLLCTLHVLYVILNSLPSLQDSFYFLFEFFNQVSDTSSHYSESASIESQCTLLTLDPPLSPSVDMYYDVHLHILPPSIPNSYSMYHGHTITTSPSSHHHQHIFLTFNIHSFLCVPTSLTHQDRLHYQVEVPYRYHGQNNVSHCVLVHVRVNIHVLAW